MADEHCSHCISGSILPVTPSGEETVVGGVNSYIAKPKKATHSAVVIATDVFGYALPNVRYIADQMAEAGGFLVVVPDIFSGTAVPAELLPVMEENPNAMELPQVKTALDTFRAKHGDIASKLTIIEAVIKELKEKHGILKVGVQGYCYGGKIAVLLAGKPDKVDAFATAHPSRLTVEEIEAIQKPGLFCCAEIDQTFTPDLRAKTEEVLNKKGLPNKFVDYKGMVHGFAIRGNSKVENVAASAKDALQQAVSFFSQYLQ